MESEGYTEYTIINNQFQNLKRADFETPREKLLLNIHVVVGWGSILIYPAPGFHKTPLLMLISPLKSSTGKGLCMNE